MGDFFILPDETGLNLPSRDLVVILNCDRLLRIKDDRFQRASPLPI